MEPPPSKCRWFPLDTPQDSWGTLLFLTFLLNSHHILQKRFELLMFSIYATFIYGALHWFQGIYLGFSVNMTKK